MCFLNFFGRGQSKNPLGSLKILPKTPVSIGGGRRFGMGQNHRGSGDEVPRRWRIFKVVTSKFYAFLVVFHTFSPTYAYVFSVFAGIIPLNLRNGGIWYHMPPLSASGGGNCPLCPPPAPPPMAVSRICCFSAGEGGKFDVSPLTKRAAHHVFTSILIWKICFELSLTTNQKTT